MSEAREWRFYLDDMVGLWSIIQDDVPVLLVRLEALRAGYWQ
jgi:hypothetical protein